MSGDARAEAYRRARLARLAREAGDKTSAASGAGERKETAGLYAGGYDPPDLFGPDDLDAIDFDPLRDLGLPGEPPYTRGIRPRMYRGRLWTMRQYAGFGTAEESNARFRYLLERGQTGLSVAFDLPTQMGR